MACTVSARDGAVSSDSAHGIPADEFPLRVQGQGDGTAAVRMAEIEETLVKLITLAKNKGYIGSDCTIESLKDDVRQRREDMDQKDDEEQLNAMKTDLAAQTASV